ncbi:FecR family protein [Parapedobacter soli]|uniref:FecR family protein n=1 Tax=Parapedobacter soli TaxID=416955 RepID=UPI0021C5AC42|nr:FecR family protein [Parapedobacter soli]
MDSNRLQQLLTQYFENTITREDCEELLAYLDDGDPEGVSGAIDRAFQKRSFAALRFDPERKDTIYNQLIAEIRQRQAVSSQQLPAHKFSIAPWLKVAALLIAAVTVGFLLYQATGTGFGVSPEVSENKNEITLPEHNEATLTLADGSTILLNDSSGGVLARELGVEIRKDADGSIFYEARGGDVVEAALKYNTFSTPKGSTYRILLPDGTKVWMNTASSIRYPVMFTGAERSISLIGEAYFEVAPDASKPFKVEANGSVIQVLGTHFNVSAYADEQQTTTTLLEGAVNVSNSGNMVTLKPNQQAVVDILTGAIRQSAANVRSAVAWKDGYFRFDDESIEEIIDKVSRWYDIEAVEYRGEFNERFSGTFQRSKNVSQLFSNLEKLAPIQFEIKERRVVIMR